MSAASYSIYTCGKQQVPMSSKRTQADVNSGSDVNAQPGAKRSRLSKIREKRYACVENGCDKFYSRAEHLYRHQLNRKLPTSHFIA